MQVIKPHHSAVCCDKSTVTTRRNVTIISSFQMGEYGTPRPYFILARRPFFERVRMADTCNHWALLSVATMIWLVSSRCKVNATRAFQQLGKPKKARNVTKGSRKIASWRDTTNWP